LKKLERKIMNIEVLFITISTLGTAIWTVLTWTEQQEKERDSSQRQIDALYINPFIMAAQELQLLLYNILAKDELGFVRKNISPEGESEDEITDSEALEIVYVIIK